jgi:hypothetical protein
MGINLTQKNSESIAAPKIPHSRKVYFPSSLIQMGLN